MNTRVAAVVAGVCVLIVSGVTALSQEAPAPTSACTRPVGDLNGDGVRDYAVSDTRMPGVAHIFYGAPDGSTRLAFVLSGPQAAPFVCSDGPAPTQATAPAAAVSVVSPITTPLGPPPRYVIVDFDPIQGTSVASGLNAFGRVVGRSTFAGSDHAFVYDTHNGMRDLGTLGGHFSDAFAINDAGVIVGYSLTGATDDFGFVNAPFVADDTGMRGFGPEFEGGVAYGISEHGWIVGERRPILGDRLRQAFLQRDGVTFDLGSLLQADDTRTGISTARAINRAGQIVGDSATFVLAGTPPRRLSFAHAFVYEGGELIDLGSFGVFCRPFPEGGERCSDSSTATDINAHGQIVGSSLSEAGSRAFVTNADRTLRNLGTLGGNQSWGYGLNDSGQVVGGSINVDGEPQVYVPFLYDDGTMYNLNDLVVNPTPDRPFAAYGINNFGQIAGNHHLLTPIYDTLTTGRDLSVTAALGATVGFEYWVTRNEAACLAKRNRMLRVQARVAGGAWSHVATTTTDCEAATDWSLGSVKIPKPLRQTTAQIDLRVVESGARSSDPIVYVRRMTTQ